MVKVLNILEEARLGGPQHRVVKVAAAMSSDVETVFVFPLEGSDRLRVLCDVSNVKYKALSIKTLRKNVKDIFFYIINFPFDILKLVRTVEQQEIDLIHVSGGVWQIKGVISGIITKKKIIWHLNDTSSLMIFRILFSVLSKFSHGIIFSGFNTWNYYKNWAPKNIFSQIIPAPYSLDLNKISMRRDPLDLRRIKIGVVANVVPVKGILDLVEVASLLNRYNEVYHIYVAGAVSNNQSEYYRHCLKAAERRGVTNINYLGYVENIEDFFSSMDLYLCVSKFEASPVSVWNAAASGLPIVSTDVGDVRVTLGDCACIHKSGDNEALAGAIHRLVSDANAYSSAGACAKRVRASHNPGIIASNTREFYNRVMGV